MPNLKFRASFQYVQEFVLCQSVKSGEPVVFSTCPRTAHDTAIVKRKAIGTHTPSSVAKPSLKVANTDLISGICGKALENLVDNLSLCHNSCFLVTSILLQDACQTSGGILKNIVGWS